MFFSTNNKKYKWVLLAAAAVVCAAAAAIFLNRAEAGETFAGIHDGLETETPYISQEEFEERLAESMNTYFYYQKDSDLYMESFLDCMGERADYIALHCAHDDRKYPDPQEYQIKVIIQPENKGIGTFAGVLSVYGGRYYGFFPDFHFTKRVDFSTLETMKETDDYEEGTDMLYYLDLQEEDKPWYHTEADHTVFRSKIWYQGKLTAGSGQKPRNTDFVGKEWETARVQDWAETYFDEENWGEVEEIGIRDFGPYDYETIVTARVHSGDKLADVIVPFYFGQDNINKSFELDEKRDAEYLKTLRENLTVTWKPGTLNFY